MGAMNLCVCGCGQTTSTDTAQGHHWRLKKDRFWERVNRDNDEECWGWGGFVGPNGYGQHTWAKKTFLAHRFAYELAVGPIPDGLQIDHLCRNRSCVNPKHMEVVTPRTNTLRSNAVSALNAVKTHCPQGHEFSEANTGIYRGSRYCKTCRREFARKYRVQRKVGLGQTKRELLKAAVVETGFTFDYLLPIAGWEL